MSIRFVFPWTIEAYATSYGELARSRVQTGQRGQATILMICAGFVDAQRVCFEQACRELAKGHHKTEPLDGFILQQLTD